MSHTQGSEQSELIDDPLFLTIDNGTQSIRALLFDKTGNLVAKSKIELTPYFSSQPGYAEQDPAYYWSSLCNACQQLWANNTIDKHRIVAMAVTTQRDTMINLNKDGETIRPAILWLDQRVANDLSPMPWYWNTAFKLVGEASSVNYFRRKAKANWYQAHEPETWQQTDKFLLLSAWLNYRLTGQFHDSVANTVGYLPFDYKKQCWAGKHDWKWSALPIKPDMLPTLFKPGERLGYVSKSVAEQTGIPANLPVLAAASDKACEVLGSGCFDPTTASLSYGTTATVNTNNPAYVEPLPFVPPYPSAIPDYYNSEVMIYRGFWMVSWFKQEFGLREQQLAKERGVTPESLFDELVDKVPPGSMGLMLQPYWSPGLKNQEAKGAILGFGDVHTRAHIYRAILEGLAYALREGKENLEKRQKKKIRRLMVSGGGSQSDAALQLTADIFNLDVHRPHTYETSGLGAAINIAVGMGYYEDYHQAAHAMTRIDKTFRPNQSNVQLYNRLYKEVYKPMYKRLKPIYQTIKDITGYPAEH